MINNLPPRDTRPEEPQAATGIDLDRTVDAINYNGDALSGDLLVTGLSTPVPLLPRQSQEHALPTNTSEAELGRPLGREKVASTIEPPGSALHDPSRPFHDQGHVPLYDPYRNPHNGQNYGGLPHTATTQLSKTPLISPYAVPHVGHSNNSDVYPPPGGSLDIPQPGTGSRTPLPPSQTTIPTIGRLNEHRTSIIPRTEYDEDTRLDYHDYGPPISPVPTPHVHTLCGTSAGPNTGSILALDTPRHQNDLPNEGLYGSELEQPPLVVTQKENLTGTLSFPDSFRGESGRRDVGVSLSGPSLTFLHPELVDHHQRYHASSVRLFRVQDDAGASGSSTISPDVPLGGVRHQKAKKRKRSPYELDAVRHYSRSSRRAPSDRFTQTQAIPQPPPITHRIKINQPRYVSENSQNNWTPQISVDFSVNGQPGVRLTDALDPHFPGPDRRDDKMFQYSGAGSSISCRIHFPGYPPQSSQITTADHRKDHNPKTRKKLAFEVAKRIKRYVEELKVGVRPEGIVLTQLVHVSKASWQPEIWYEQELTNDS